MAEHHLGYRLQLLTREHAAARVVGRVEHEHPRPVRDEGCELLRVRTEAVLLSERDGYGPRSAEGGDRLVHREAGVGVEDLVALLAQGQDREEHDRLGAGGDDHAFGRAA